MSSNVRDNDLGQQKYFPLIAVWWYWHALVLRLIVKSLCCIQFLNCVCLSLFCLQRNKELTNNFNRRPDIVLQRKLFLKSFSQLSCQKLQTFTTPQASDRGGQHRLPQRGHGQVQWASQNGEIPAVFKKKNLQFWHTYSIFRPGVLTDLQYRPIWIRDSLCCLDRHALLTILNNWQIFSTEIPALLTNYLVLANLKYWDNSTLDIYLLLTHSEYLTGLQHLHLKYWRTL